MILYASGCSGMLEIEKYKPMCSSLEMVQLLTKEINELSIETLRQIDNNNQEIEYYCYD